MTRKALEYLEEAETALLSHMRNVSESLRADNEDFPDVNPVLLAVQRLISRAAGAIEEALNTEKK